MKTKRKLIEPPAKCKISANDIDDAIKSLLKKIVRERKVQPEDVDAWAEKIAKDVAEAND